MADDKSPPSPTKPAPGSAPPSTASPPVIEDLALEHPSSAAEETKDPTGGRLSAAAEETKDPTGGRLSAAAEGIEDPSPDRLSAAAESTSVERVSAEAEGIEDPPGECLSAAAEGIEDPSLDRLSAAAAGWIGAADGKAAALLGVSNILLGALFLTEFEASGVCAIALRFIFIVIVALMHMAVAIGVLWPRTNRSQILEDAEFPEPLEESPSYYGDIAKLKYNAYVNVLSAKNRQRADRIEQAFILAHIANRKMLWFRGTIVLFLISVALFSIIAALAIPKVGAPNDTPNTLAQEVCQQQKSKADTSKVIIPSALPESTPDTESSETATPPAHK